MYVINVLKKKLHSYCDICKKCILTCESHCDRCNECSTKKHCMKCNICVQRNYNHCDVCEECVHPSLVHDIFTNKCISSRDL